VQAAPRSVPPEDAGKARASPHDGRSQESHSDECDGSRRGECGAATSSGLVEAQIEYAAWLDRLPENLRDSALAEALQAICDLDLTELQARLRKRLTAIASQLAPVLRRGPFCTPIWSAPLRVDRIKLLI
jgi:hypothetical protein